MSSLSANSYSYENGPFQESWDAGGCVSISTNCCWQKNWWLIEDLDAPKLGCNIWVRICTDKLSQMTCGERETAGQWKGLGRSGQGGRVGRGMLRGMTAEGAVGQG